MTCAWAPTAQRREGIGFSSGWVASRGNQASLCSASSRRRRRSRCPWTRADRPGSERRPRGRKSRDATIRSVDDEDTAGGGRHGNRSGILGLPRPLTSRSRWCDERTVGRAFGDATLAAFGDGPGQCVDGHHVRIGRFGIAEHRHVAPGGRKCLEVRARAADDAAVGRVAGDPLGDPIAAGRRPDRGDVIRAHRRRAAADHGNCYVEGRGEVVERDGGGNASRAVSMTGRCHDQTPRRLRGCRTRSGRRGCPASDAGVVSGHSCGVSVETSAARIPDGAIPAPTTSCAPPVAGANAPTCGCA